MTKEVINIGATANDGTGTPNRTAWGMVNSNFDELYGFIDGLEVTSLAALPAASSVTLTWVEPSSTTVSVLYYVVFYRELDSNAWLQYGTNATEESLEIQNLRNGIEHEFIVVPFTSQGFGKESAIVTARPTGNIQPLYKLLSGVCALWDTRTYNGSDPAWAQSCPVPADGALKADYDVWLGTDSGTTQNPTWDISRFTLDNDNFTLVGSNPPLVNSMHKASFGVEWTFFGKFKTGNSLAASAIFATCYQDGQYGIVIRHDSSGNIKVDQYDGTTHTTVEFDMTVSAATYYYFAVSYDFSTDRLYLSLDGSDFELQEAGFTAVTQNASAALRLCSNSNNASRFAAGSEVLGFGLIDRRLKAPELAVLNSWLANYFDPPAYTIPDAPYGLILAPTSGGLFASVSTPQSYGGTPSRSHGGTPITDYKWEYKLSSEPTLWTTFTHTASPVPRITITGLSNGSAYDVRVSAVNAIGVGGVSETASMTPAALPVSGVFDLSDYKCTFPDNASGYRDNQFGYAREVTQPTFGASGFGGQCSYFYTTASYYCYQVPDGGAATSSSAYAARTELRNETDEEPDASGENSVKFSVERLVYAGSGSCKTIVHQIHRLEDDEQGDAIARGNPTFKLQVVRDSTGTGIKLYALVKAVDQRKAGGEQISGAITLLRNDGSTDTNYVAGTDIRVPYSTGSFLYVGDIGDIVTSRVVYTYNASSTPNNPLSTLDFYINGVLIATQRIHMEFKWYWKSGNYYQASTPAKLGHICEVRHYAP